MNVNVKGFGSNAYVKIDDIVSILRKEANTINMLSLEDRIQNIADQIESLAIINRIGPFVAKVND